MNSRLAPKLIVTIAGLIACLAASASAADSQDERASLAGLKAISIVVEELSAAAAPSGLTTKMLQDDVELRLVPTWSLDRLGLASTGTLRVNIVGRVDEFVDQFIKAYQSVNRKP